MMANVADTAAPAYAIRIWADERSIYCELPSINGPAVMSFSRTEGGLSQALHLLGAMHKEHSGEPYVRPIVPSKDLQKKGLTKVDIDAARETLKKLGVI